MKTTASRILILTSGPLCRNPRVLKEAQALGGHGFDVTVMALANLARFEAYDDEIMRTAPFKKVALDHLSTDWRTRARFNGSRIATWLARRAARFGLQSGQALGPLYSLGAMARAFPCDLILVHTELPMVIGKNLLAQGRRVAVDFEDWHSRDLLPGAQTHRPITLISQVERALLREAVYTSTTSEAMAAALQEASGGTRPVVITNSFPLQSAPRPAGRKGVPSCFWFSQTIGPGRGLEAFLAAWQATRAPSRLCLLGDVDPSYREGLIRLLPPEKRSQLEFLPIVSPEELPATIARHDIGLALEESEPANKNYTISNKILQYLNAGLGVLATGTAGQREVLARAPASGHVVDLTQTAELTHLLEALLTDAARRDAMGTAARRAAEEFYCWEKETPRLIAAVEQALHTPVPGHAT